MLNGYAENTWNSLLETLLINVHNNLSHALSINLVDFFKKVSLYSTNIEVVNLLPISHHKTYLIRASIYKNDFLMIFYCLRVLNLKSARILN